MCCDQWHVFVNEVIYKCSEFLGLDCDILFAELVNYYLNSYIECMYLGIDFETVVLSSAVHLLYSRVL